MQRKTIVAAVGIAVAGVAATTVTKHQRDKKVAKQKAEETRNDQQIVPEGTFQGIDWSKV